FSMPQLFRYERQQRGRLREHFQLNMDILGEPGPLADAELIAAAVDVLRMLGFRADTVRARVSDRRLAHALLEGQGLSEPQIALAYAHIDKLEREPRDQLVQSLAKAGGLDADTAGRIMDLGAIKSLDGARAALERSGTDGRAVEELAECVGALQAMGLGDYVDVDVSVVRGLAYYTGIVFELFDAGRSLRAICGGGRYDGLLHALGGVDLPATGFGMGDVVLGELVKAGAGAAPEPPRLDAFLVAVTGEDLGEVLRLAHEMRDAGVRVEFALKQQSMAKQLKLAAARRARLAVLVGPDERERGEAVVRNLDTGAEERRPFADLAGAARREGA
ncbi:MAG: ATP phosphoribosyltransferase regulatory subunit, partial [Gemmatimonadota bacterium]